MAVKSWATYRALALMFRDLGDKKKPEKCQHLAEKVAGVVSEQAVDGILPAIFEKDNPGYHSRILPAVEGCVYPLYFAKTGYAGVKPDEIYGSAGRKEDVRGAEGTHQEAADRSQASQHLRRRRHQALLHLQQFVDEQDLDLHACDAARSSISTRIRQVAEVFKKADAAHVKWQTVGSAYWACCDQIVSGEGKASRYYPRIITSALWLD